MMSVMESRLDVGCDVLHTIQDIEKGINARNPKADSTDLPSSQPMGPVGFEPTTNRL